VQHLQDAMMGQGMPAELAAVGPGAHPQREQQALLREGLDGGPGRAGAGEGRKQVAHSLLHAQVGVQDHPADGVVDEPDRQGHRQLAAAGLGELAATQAGLEQVQLGLAHGAFEAQDQPVVERAGVIQAVLVQDQRAGQRADLQQPVPVGVVARQPGDFQAQHDAGPAHADVGDQPLEAVAALGGGARASQVLVDHDHLLGRPAQRDRPLAQRVLAVGGGGVLDHLAQGGLAHIQVGGPAQVLCGHLLGGIGCHQLAPLGPAAC
jgi:hypothetical protein